MGVTEQRGLRDELDMGTTEQALAVMPRFPMENAKAFD